MGWGALPAFLAPRFSGEVGRVLLRAPPPAPAAEPVDASLRQRKPADSAAHLRGRMIRG